MIDGKSGKRLNSPDFVFAPGPQANEGMRARINFARERAAEAAANDAAATQPKAAAPVKAPRKKAAARSA